jgi:D-inositol-3-phosphate glycosyltransferase
LVITFHALGSVKQRMQGENDSSPWQRVQLERSLARAADRVIATCTDEVVELEAMGAAKANIEVVPCGVDLTRFQPDGPAAPRSKRPRIVALSRLVPRKGIDDAVRALASVPDAELIVVGGPESSGLALDPEASRLRRLAGSLDLGARVHLLGGLPHHEIPALLRSADIVVAVPWYEPFGIAPVEAMACGVPVVGTAVGGLLDTVRPEVTGLLVPPRAPERLAEALNQLLDEPDRRRRMGVAARQHAVANYSWARVAEATEGHYLRVQREERVANVTAAGTLR